MRIRDVVIGSVATLIVTVAGGVIVAFATKEPDSAKRERLIYTKNDSAKFSGVEQEIVFTSLVVTNVGGVSSKQVSIIVSLEAAEIRDFSVIAAGGARESKRERLPKRLSLYYETLLPKESITVNLLLTKSEKINLDVRSDSMLAEEISSIGNLTAQKPSGLLKLGEDVAPASSLIAALVTAVLLVFMRRRGVFFFDSDVNNAAFVLLHSGLARDAEAALGKAVANGRYDPFVLSNFALAKAAIGQHDEARRLLNSAKFRRGIQGHALAVVLFNEGTIELIQGEKVNALESLKKAIELSPKEVNSYIDKSCFYESVRDSAEFKSLVPGARKAVER